MPRKTYSSKKVNGKLKVNQLSNLAIYGEENFRIAKLTRRKGVPPVSAWKFVRTFSGATIYELPNKERIVVKPELWVPFPNAKVAARGNNRGRYMLPLLNELVKRRVKIEIPLGEIEAKNGHKFYITKFVPGTQIGKVFFTLTKAQQIEIAKQMGRQLAQIHSRGVVHSHPHDRNWLIHEGKVRLVDVKAVKFKEEFPWHTNTGRTVTWEDVKQGDLAIALEVFHGNAKHLTEIEQALRREYELRVNRLTV